MLGKVGERYGYEFSCTTGDLSKNLDEIQEKLGCVFRNSNLLFSALTHSSLANERQCVQLSPESFNRLEFFGDAILSSIVAEYLIDEFPDFNEGALSECKNRLVSNDACFQYAAHLNLHRYVCVSKSVQTTNNPAAYKKVLADTFEALIGAIARDKQQNAARAFFKRAVAVLVKGLIIENSKDWKKLLLKYSQQFSQTPNYDRVMYINKYVEEVIYPNITEMYPKYCSCAHGSGETERLAQQDAAKNALAEIGLIPQDSDSLNTVYPHMIAKFSIDGFRCRQSLPCQHLVEVVLKDGRICRAVLGSLSILPIAQSLLPWRVEYGWSREHLSSGFEIQRIKTFSRADKILTNIFASLWPLPELTDLKQPEIEKPEEQPNSCLVA